MPRGSDRRARRRQRAAATSIYLIATIDALGNDWLDRIRAALQSGVIGMIQLRANEISKSVSTTAWRHAATTLRTALDGVQVMLILNDDVTLAAELDFDGAHVGQDDMPVARARAVLGPDRLLGLSTHTPEEIQACPTDHLDLLGLGPCFPTTSKAISREPQGAALMTSCLPIQSALPVFPIGGIDVTNVSVLIAAGATRVAVGHAVLDASDPERAARDLAAAMEPAG